MARMVVWTGFLAAILITGDIWAQDTPPVDDEPSQPRMPEEPDPEPADEPPPPPRTEKRPLQDVRPHVEPEIQTQPAPPAAQENVEEPAVRAKADDWGMFFRFGGLGTLLASSNTRNVSSLLISQVGMKAVLSEHMMVPFFFGTGVRHISEDQGSTSITDFGLDLGIGIEYHFRIWRRISPFFGASIGIGIQDPNGNDNLTLGIGLGPNMGVEYYIADRVSLTAQYLLVFQFENGEPPGANEKLTTIQLSTLSGGAMNLTYYF